MESVEEVNQESTFAVREKTSRNMESARGKEECSGPVLRVLQWNVLADGLAQFGNFHRVRYTSDPARGVKVEICFCMYID